MGIIEGDQPFTMVITEIGQAGLRVTERLFFIDVFERFISFQFRFKVISARKQFVVLEAGQVMRRMMPVMLEDELIEIRLPVWPLSKHEDMLNTVALHARRELAHVVDV